MRLAVLALVAFVFISLSKLGGSMSDDMLNVGSAHVGVVEVKGVIASELDASANNIIENLEDAFASENSVAVMLRINSPGGSPVEAGRINDAITRLKEQYGDKKLYTVVDEVCASGGYYIAAASDEIYADKASVVGSIGVLSSSFGFVGLMEKLGVERRLTTAGEDKGIFDPFSEQSPQNVEHLQSLLDSIHRQFIDVVIAGRGERLHYADQKIFSGLFWNGEQALELGLVDQLGDSHALLQDLKEETDMELELVVYSNINPLDKVFGVLGASLASAFSAAGIIRLY